MKRERGQQRPFDYYEVVDSSIEFYSWCPTPEPTVPPTQVHMFFPFAGGKIFVRFKSPWTIDRVIAALQRHRADVWGEPTDEERLLAIAGLDDIKGDSL